jgi:predicted ATPase
MGAGKSTMLAALAGRGAVCVPEPARRILSAQRAIGGRGVPETDPRLFCELMLAVAIEEFRTARAVPAIFDRGIPDLVAYARLFDLEEEVFWKAAKTYRSPGPVFLFAGWPEIYATDDERKMPVELASEFGEMTRRIYGELGYAVIGMPRGSVETRVEFLLAQNALDLR